MKKLSLLMAAFALKAMLVATLFLPVSTAHSEVAANSVSCLVDPTVLDDIKKRRDELEAKEKELAARDMDLKAREKAVEEELKKLQDVRDDIAKIDASRKKDNEERIAKLVETLETMSPKPASALVASLDEALAVAAISRISTQKLAKILNIMEPKKSSRLSELLAGVVRAKGQETAALDAAATTTQSERR